MGFPYSTVFPPLARTAARQPMRAPLNRHARQPANAAALGNAHPPKAQSNPLAPSAMTGLAILSANTLRHPTTGSKYVLIAGHYIAAEKYFKPSIVTMPLGGQRSAVGIQRSADRLSRRKQR